MEDSTVRREIGARPNASSLFQLLHNVGYASLPLLGDRMNIQHGNTGEMAPAIS